jgi:cation:H+ antiporter
MPALILNIAMLIGSAVVIYLACEFFVNGVEWVGQKMNFGSKATGTILAAFGTALPESIVTLIAVAFGATAASKELGIGAALGGPLALSTIAYATVGLTLMACGRRLTPSVALRNDLRHLSRDQAWFLVVFAAKIALGLFVFAWKPWLGIAFLAAYALYVRQEMQAEGDEEGEELEPLKIQPRRGEPSGTMAAVQTLGALVVIFFASRSFVGQLELLGPALGLKPQLLALLLSPIATELPETMNAIIWVRQGKYRLALANITGAMMIQATIPTAFGLFFTPWHLSAPLLIAAAATMVSIAVMFALFRRGSITRGALASMALLYIAFAAILIAWHITG